MKSLFQGIAAIAAVLGFSSMPRARQTAREYPRQIGSQPRPAKLALDERKYFGPRQRRRRISPGLSGVLRDARNKSSAHRSRGLPAGENRNAWHSLTRRPAW